MSRSWLTILLLLCGLAAGPGDVQAADATAPHPHTGMLKPYPKPPIPTRLTPADEAALAQGKPVYKQTEGAAGGRGVAVFRVNAPAATVWSTISDFPKYPQYIDAVESCEVYKREGNAIFVRFVLRSMGVSVEYFIEHDYRRADTWGTWTLDYSRESDLSDSVGSWLVREISPGVSQVEYSIDLKVSGWVPGFVRNILVDNGLEEATQWVKVQSETEVRK